MPKSIELSAGRSGDRYRVQSLGRALDVLEAIAAAGDAGCRLTDLANGVGLSKAAAYAILLTLKARGLVIDDGTGMTRRYRLGLALLRLGELAAANTGLSEVAMPVLRDLTAATGMTSRIAMLDGGFAVVIGRVDGPGAVRFDAALGRREHPHCSGVGKVLLATMPRKAALDILRQVDRVRRTPKTLTTLAALNRDLDRVAERHYALDDEEDHEGVVCVATAVFDREGQAAGAVSVTTLKQLLPPDQIPELAHTLIRHADRISTLLGGMPADKGWAQPR